MMMQAALLLRSKDTGSSLARAASDPGELIDIPVVDVLTRSITGVFLRLPDLLASIPDIEGR